MAAVRCIDLCRTYYQGDQAIKALDHVNLEIEEGGFVCLSAPSGGGKTTLLNAIGGLDRPDKGEVWIAGQRIDNLSKGALAKLRLHQIGFVFQAFNLIPVLTARENVEFVMQIQGVPAHKRGEQSKAILAEGNSVSPSHGQLCPGRRWCWRMNRRPTSTHTTPTNLWSCSWN
jgi:putative ABC transport system ATP-binding protein